MTPRPSQSKLEPKLLTVLREGYPKGQLARDVGAGIIVGIVALPLAIAFAIASGLKPEQGLYTAIVAGFLISCLSGSRVQIGGPTGAFIVIIYGIVHQHGYDGLATATVMAGVLLVAMGFARLGTVIKYIPYPVTVGFTGGIALIIATGQVRELAGLDVAAVPSAFVEKLELFAREAHTLNLEALGLGLLTILIIVLWPRLTHRIPGPLVALVSTTALVHFLDIPVETIGARFGAVPTGLPVPRMPAMSWTLMTEMFSPAVSIALLAGIESLLSAVVADGMTGRRHRSSMELIAQGVANIASPIFGGLPATGAIARTATNVKNGGRTPIAGIVHSLVLLLIMVFLGKWAALIPMATLAGILMVVAYHMSEWRLFVKVLRGPKSDVLVLLITFILTLLIDLAVAIQVGVVLAALLFMRRMADATQMGYITALLDDGEEQDDPDRIRLRDIPKGIELFEINGPFFFGAADKFKEAINHVDKKPRVLILRLRRVLTLDATGLVALEEVHQRTSRDGTVLILSGVQDQPREVLLRSGFLQQVGEANVVASIEEAIQRGSEILR